MGEVSVKFLVEVLFLGPVSLRHPGGKWRDENCTLGLSRDTGERMYHLFWPRRGSSWTDAALAVPPQNCVCLFPMGQYCCHILPVRGMLAVACLSCLRPSFSPLEAVLKKEMLPHSGLKEPVLSNMYACLFSFLCLSLFIKCLLRGLWPRRLQPIWLEF